MSRPIHIVDAFTDVPFRGNPAAICVLDEAADAAWMQDVAAEMNLSETAFVVPRPDAAFDLRWFTPGAEVDLCGHATLAAAPRPLGRRQTGRRRPRGVPHAKWRTPREPRGR